MAQANTPPWAKRIENKLDILLQEEKCYYHKKYGAKADRKCDPPCRFALSLIKKAQETKPASLSPIVESILQYWKPIKCISPIKNELPIKKGRKRRLEKEIVPFSSMHTFHKN